MTQQDSMSQHEDKYFSVLHNLLQIMNIELRSENARNICISSLSPSYNLPLVLAQYCSCDYN